MCDGCAEKQQAIGLVELARISCRARGGASSRERSPTSALFRRSARSGVLRTRQRLPPDTKTASYNRDTGIRRSARSSLPGARSGVIMVHQTGGTPAIKNSNLKKIQFKLGLLRGRRQEPKNQTNRCKGAASGRSDRSLSLVRVCRQMICKGYPAKPAFGPGMILRPKPIRVVHASERDVDRIGQIETAVGERRAARAAKRPAHIFRGLVRSRPCSGELEAVHGEAGPGHKRCSAGAAAGPTMAVRNVGSFASRFVANASAEAAAGYYWCRLHQSLPSRR